MRVGILCTMINGFGRKGFYNSQEIGLGRALCARGHQVMIYKCVQKDQQAETLEIEENLRISYIPTSGIGAHGYLKAGVIDPNLDGILVFADNQIFLPHIERYCRKHQIAFVPYIGTAHGYPPGIKSRVSDFLFSIGTCRLYKRMPVLAKTQSAKEELSALGISDVTVSWVGLDQSALHTDFRLADRAGLRREYGFSPDDVILCNVSRMEPEKRPLDLIDIFSHIQGKKNFKLLLIGEGPLYEEVSEKIERLGLSDKVKFFRRIPYTDMWKIYTMSDYYLNLSRIEIFGMAIMEAIYYKTSVAANIASGPSVILKDMKGHTLCHNDREFEEWLCAEYPDQSLLEESAEKIQEEFNWGKTAEAFLSKIFIRS